ncbi:MAG TPA: T9SS type A sorting domain-containing protein [Bacteroidia bacterium]|nr:T9SS type A sorting domain-containing protein [Bacteroidia bacterium]
MKTTLLTTCLFLFFLLPFTNAQSYFHQTAKGGVDHRIHGDTLIILENNFTVDYYQADMNAFGANYVSQQPQLINKYYSFPTDTSNLFNTKNYDCVNSVTVAFDSLYDPYQHTSFSADTFISFGIDYVYVPIVQVNHSGKNDTLELQLKTVDAYGYPTPTILLDTLFLADSANHDSLGNMNNYQIKTLKWNLGAYFVSGAKFAVTMIYYDRSKLDSCWFIYGYHSFNTNTCPALSAGTNTLALPTDFSRIPYPSGKLIANSFALWNQYYAYGSLPTEGGNDVFYPCDTNDRTFHAGVDGANFLQDIHIYVQDTASAYLGVKNITSPFSLISQNYPNPFNDKTTITYTINKIADVNFTVVDLTGRIIISQTYTKMPPGLHSVIVNANALSPGVYFYSFSASGSTATKKMVVY